MIVKISFVFSFVALVRLFTAYVMDINFDILAANISMFTDNTEKTIRFIGMILCMIKIINENAFII